MGIEAFEQPRFFIETENGDRVEISIQEIEIADPDVSPTSADNPFCYTGFSRMKVTLNAQAVSRKRIMKLLIAHGDLYF